MDVNNLGVSFAHIHHMKMHLTISKSFFFAANTSSSGWKQGAKKEVLGSHGRGTPRVRKY